jgi:hypothetical protein
MCSINQITNPNPSIVIHALLDNNIYIYVYMHIHTTDSNEPLALLYEGCAIMLHSSAQNPYLITVYMVLLIHEKHTSFRNLWFSL